MILVSQICDLWIEYQFGAQPVDQVAVNQLKTTLNNPALLGATIAAIVLVAPFIEEVLFRGFLQTWLRRFLKPRFAIPIVSFIFASFHFSVLQGLTNITLILSLFVLSCFLGLLYEKQKTLWSPIVLHMLFNGINVSMILT